MTAPRRRRAPSRPNRGYYALAVFVGALNVLLLASVVLTVGEPQPLLAVHVGQYVELPSPLDDGCRWLVLFHGSCRGCETLVSGRERAQWVTDEPHAGDRLYPNVVVSPRAFGVLMDLERGVGGIPAEIVVDSGLVRMWQAPRPGNAYLNPCGVD